MFKTSLFLLVLFFTFPKAQNQVIPDKKSKEKTFEKDCKNLQVYPFKDRLIDLNNLKEVFLDGFPEEHFKHCSRYARRFQTSFFKDSLIVQDRTFKILAKKDTKEYKLNIFGKQRLLKTIQLPVEQPSSSDHFWLLRHKDDVIVIMEDTYSTYYRIVKYDYQGNKMMQTDIEHTYITHPEPNTDHHHSYLSLYDVTKSEMVFSSHHFSAEKSKTVFLDLDNFTTSEYNQTAHGLILDEKDEEAIGFNTYEEKDASDNNTYKVSMFEGKNYKFTIPYGSEGCDLILKDKCLYFANYHPIATGSSLYCVDIEKNKIKWKADVLQVNASHSEYQNDVTLSFYEDKLIMEGNESYGDYVQIFDSQTGKRLATFGSIIE